MDCLGIVSSLILNLLLQWSKRAQCVREVAAQSDNHPDKLVAPRMAAQALKGKGLM